MKTCLFLLVLIFASFGAQASNQQINIQTKSFSSGVTVYSFEQPTVVSEQYDPNNFFNSEITFKISGILEGNFCEAQHASLQLGYNKKLSNDLNVKAYDVSITTFTKLNHTIQMTEAVCTLATSPTKFEVMAKVIPFVNSNGSGEMTWIYRFRNKSGDNKKLVVTLSKPNGWSWKFEQL